MQIMINPVRENFDSNPSSQDEGQRPTKSPLTSANDPKGAWIGLLVKPREIK
jgi:hypothetical protein